MPTVQLALRRYAEGVKSPNITAFRFYQFGRNVAPGGVRRLLNRPGACR